MRKTLSMTAVIVAAMTTPVSAQEFGGTEQPTFELSPDGNFYRPAARSRGFGAQAPQFSPLRQALSKYYTAKSADEKDAAAKTIQESLTKEFDADLKKRQADLDAIRKRVEEMEKSLLKRKANRQAIIDLRKQVLLNESEGLGWSAGGGKGARDFPPMLPPTYGTGPVRPSAGFPIRDPAR